MRWLLFLISFLRSCWLIWGQRERNRQPGRPGLGGLEAQQEERVAGRPGVHTAPASGPQTPRERLRPAEHPAAGSLRLAGPAFQLGCGCPELPAQGLREPPAPTGPGGVGCGAAVKVTLRPWSPAACGAHPSERFRKTLIQGVG